MTTTTFSVRCSLAAALSISALVAVAAGCTADVTSKGTGGMGTLGGPDGGTTSGGSSGGPGVVVDNPPPFQPAPGMLRRLTKAQFHNALLDVFGFDADVTDVDSDNWAGNFATIGAAVVVTSPVGAEQYQSIVESAANAVFSDATKRAKFIGCTPTTSANDACTRNFIQTIGRRAWRRPLEAAEVDRFATLAQSAATALASATEGLHWATVALFGSPNFLYRPELGAPAAGGSLRLTGYEVASRLAFLIWNSLPDDQLLDAAANGSLATADGIRTAAQRLLDAPAGRQAVGDFAEQYMRLDRILTQAKDAGLFPEYGPGLQAGMVRDMRATWESVAFDDQASVMTLFSTTKVFANSDLATLYGLDATGLDSNTFKAFSLPADGPRLGILSKAGFLSQFANQQEGSPTLRGKFIRDALMCRIVPPPPMNVSPVFPDPPAGVKWTKRQRLEAHRSNATCASCHGLMDPLGLPLENFDAVGRYRTLDNGLPVVPTGDVDGTAVANAREMGVALGSNTGIEGCLVRRYYTYAVGHEERDVDGSVVNALSASFAASGFKLKNLVVDTVAHDSFSAVAPQP